MAKATLVFNLDDPDDCRLFEQANNASRLVSALEQIGNQLRAARKYGGKEAMTHEELEALYYDAVEDIQHLLP